MQIQTFDVIIPVYRPDRSFKLLLKALHKQTLRPNRILLIHTCEEGETLPAAEAYEDVTVFPIRKEEFDHGGTRRMGAALSTADALVFMTQDALPQDDLLFEALLAPFADEKVGVTYARQLPRKNVSMAEKYIRTFNYPAHDERKTKADLSKRGIKTYFCSDVCAAYRRDRYEELGGFSEPLLFNEDMILASRFIQKGYAVYYASQAMVVHSHRYSNLQQFRRNFDLGVSQADHPEVFSEISSESEGGRMVRSVCKYLIERKRPYLIPGFFLTCFFKYAGFFLGKHHTRLSEKQVLFCTSDPSYWKKNGF